MDKIKFPQFLGAGPFTFSPYASKRYNREMFIAPEGMAVILSQSRDVIIEPGFLFDGASAPRIVWPLIPRHGSYGRAVQLHDKLCETLKVNEDGKEIDITRKEADEYFFSGMRSLGVNSFQVACIRMAVASYRVFSRTNKPNILEGKETAQKLALAEYEEMQNAKPQRL